MWAEILAPMKFKNEKIKKKKGGKVLEVWKWKTCAYLFVYYLPHKCEKKRKKAEVMHTPWNLILVYLDAENDSFNSEQTVVSIKFSFGAVLCWECPRFTSNLLVFLLIFDYV